MTGTEATVRSAIDDVRASYELAVRAIEGIPDNQQAFELATQLRDEMDGLVGEAADLRARMVGRIWEAEELSLAALANRIGVSKSRAGQFIETVRSAKTKEEP